MEPTIGLAFLAGFLSFVSPCVLPLVPAYIGYMGGRLTHTVAVQSAVGGTAVADNAGERLRQRFLTVFHGLAFVGGFTFIFVVLGLLATAFVVQIGRQNLSLIETLIARAGGVLIIFFGLHYMGVLPSLFARLTRERTLISHPLFSVAVAAGGALLILWALVDPLLALPVLAAFLLWMALGGAFTSPAAFWERTIGGLQRALYSEVRLRMTASGQQSFATSALMGVVFAAGWTPCIGPVYGAVLTMAANGGDVGQAGVLLGAYSLGLGIPFLVTALLMDSAQVFLRRLQRYMHRIELATGAFLVAIGVLIASGQLQQLSSTFAARFTDLSVRIEECVLGFATGEMPLSDVGPCLNGTVVAQAPDIIGPEAPTLTGDTLAGGADAPGGLRSITDLAARAPAASGAIRPEPGIERGDRAMNFRFTTASGEDMMLADLRGSVVLLNFWATWCGPCRTEMAAFEETYRARQDNGLVVLAVNNRETLEQIRGFEAELGLTFPLALDPNGDIQNLYGIRQYPTTLVIDREGVITTRHVGPLERAQIERLTAALLS